MMESPIDDLPVDVGLVAMPADPGRAGALARSVAGRELARVLLARASHRQGWEVVRPANGRPRPWHSAGVSGLTLSISHSGRVVAAAVSAYGPIGIDVETQRPRSNYLDLAAYAFGAAECSRVAHDGLAGFYRIWTLREAIAKASGDGLGLVIDGTDRVAEAPPAKFWVTADRRWHLASLEPCAEIAMALALPSTRPIEASSWRPRTVAWLEPDAGYRPLQSSPPSFT